MEDTIIGYALNELMFCSAADHDYFLNTSCPVDCVTQDNPFWNAASIHFAKQARGDATLVLNGTRTFGAFVNTSTFYRFELPNIDPNRVHKLKVLLLHDLDREKYETCREPKTLQNLKIMIEEKGIAYECEDDSFEIRLLMCSRSPNASECHYLKNSASFENRFNFGFQSLVLFLIGFFWFLF